MEHLINLNFAPGGLPAVIHVSQYDDTLRQLKFQLWFGRSKVEVPSGAAVRVDIKKPDGHIVLVSGTVDTQDRSIVTVPTTKQMTAAPGGARGMLVVTGSGDKRISSALFILQVHSDPVEDGDASDSDLSMLQDAIDQTAANATAAQAAATAAQQAASSFTTDTTLSVSGKAADAKKTGDELTAIKADLEDEVGVFKWIKGKYINLNANTVSFTPIVNEIMTYTVVDCSEGDSFIINAVGATGGRVWGFVDTNNRVISKADSNVTVTNLTLIAPANAVKLIINNKGDGENHGLCYRLGSNLMSEVQTAKKGGSGLSDEAKEALLTCFKHAVWTDDSAYEYKNNLRKALYGWDTDTMYKLMNTPVSLDGSTTINTDAIIWKTDHSFTLFAEYIDNTNHSVDTENKMLFRQIRLNPWGAFYLQTYNGGNSGSNYNVTTVLDFVSGSGDSVRRVWKHLESRTVNPHTPRRVVVTYSAESNSVTMDFSVNGQIVAPDSTTGNVNNFDFYEMAGDKPMLIGSLEEKTRFFNGVINDFRIIKKTATSSEIAEYLSGGNNT